jgi:hypothetical protein
MIENEEVSYRRAIKKSNKIEVIVRVQIRTT